MGKSNAPLSTQGDCVECFGSRSAAHACAFAASQSASEQGMRVEISFRVMAPRRLDNVENEQSYSKIDQASRLSSSCFRHVFQRASSCSLVSREKGVSSVWGRPGELGAEDGDDAGGERVPENKPIRRAFPIRKLLETSAES